MAEITLAKALKVKNRLAGRLAKVQADIQAFNSVPHGQAGQVNVPVLMQAREELVGALGASRRRSTTPTARPSATSTPWPRRRRRPSSSRA